MNKKKFLGAVLLQILFLVGMIAFNFSIVWFGQEVLLEIVPIDPYSMFSGEYVQLNYKISNLSLEEIKTPGTLDRDDWEDYFQPGFKVYVSLQPVGDIYRAVSISKDRDDLKDGLIIAGRVEYFSPNMGMTQGPGVAVSYGIESFYTSEGESKKYEELGPERIRVRVAIDPLGRSRVVGLKIVQDNP